MTELLELFEQMTTKEMTTAFNELPVDKRIEFLSGLLDGEKTQFVKKIRKQAVADFWTHERELIEQGQSTRDWTPEQIEEIMHISEKTGKESINGDVAIDINGEAYYGHHMLDVSTHPEYAGDWRNIQALDYDEHYYGAHKGHDTKEPTNGYYDVETKETIVIDIPEGGVDFDNLDYPPKTTCIFKSNEEIKTLYHTDEKVTDGELLALKNLELATTPNGGLADFERCLDVAERYQCSDFEVKYGIMSEFDITNKYAFWENMTYKDKLAFRAYEYYKDIGVSESCIEKLGIPSDTIFMQKYNFVDIGDSGLDMLRAYEYQYRYYVAIPDTKVYFDEKGNIIGLSHFDSSISEKSTYEISLSDAANYQSDGDMLFKYADYNSYSELDKIKASQYDYERRVIASMMEEGIVSKDGITLTSLESLKSEYNLTEDIVSADVLTELQLIEYREAKYGMNAMEDSFARVLSTGNQELISFFLNHSDMNTMNAVMEKVLEKGYASATDNFFEQYKKADLIIDLSKGELCSNFNDKVMNVILSNTQIEQLNGVSKTDLATLYKTVTLTDVIDVLKVTGNATAQEYTYYNCYDGEGKLLGVEIYVEGTNHTLKTVSGDIAYKGLTSDIVDFASDDIMEEKFGSDRYQVLTATEKLELKEFDKVVRDLTVIGDQAYASNVVESYIQAANKSADSLNEIDKALIGFANELYHHRPDEIADTRLAKSHSAYRYVKTFFIYL